MTGPNGCGACSEVGLIEVAHHRRDHSGSVVVECRMVPCSCLRGEHWQARRAEPRTDSHRPTSRTLTAPEYADHLRQRPDTVAVFLAPTPGQRRPDRREPVLSPEGEARLRAHLDAVAMRRGLAPHPASSDDDMGPMW